MTLCDFIFQRSPVTILNPLVGTTETNAHIKQELHNCDVLPGVVLLNASLELQQPHYSQSRHKPKDPMQGKMENTVL